MSEPTKTLWRIEPVAIVPAESQEAALTLARVWIQKLGGTYVGGGAAKVREGSDE